MSKLLCTAAAMGLLVFGPIAQAGIVELDITASWLASDYDVSATPTGLPEANDGKVFGVSPSNGSISFTLLVNTSSVSTFLVGGAETVVHNHYGYTDVSLKSPVTFGTATWNTDDIVTNLIGPAGAATSLWTDTDLTMADPTLLSLRMFGEWTGTGGTDTADMFIGSRYFGSSGYGISNSFLAWEYFAGEEIRTTGYSATVHAVPEPSSIALLALGLAGLGATRRRNNC